MADGEWQKEVENGLKKWLNDIYENKAFGEIPIISDVAYILATLLSGLSIMATGWLESIIKGILQVLVDSANFLIFNPLSRELDTILNFFVSRRFIAHETKEIIDDISKQLSEGGSILKVVLYILSVLSAFMSIIEVSNVPTQQEILNRIRPMIPTVEHLIRLLYLDPDDNNENYDLLHRYGFNDDMIRKMKDSQKSLLSQENIQLMYWRGLLTLQDANDELRKNGYDAVRSNLLLNSWQLIPSVQDLLWMVGKEAFEPDQIQDYGLDDEFPHEQQAWMEKQGLSEYWQKKYWAAHWDYPSIQQVLEMFHRGLITEEQVYNYYRVVEIPPYWRKMLMKISHRVYTRVDLRRMHALGVVGDEALVKNYKDQGYDQEHAEAMSEFTIKYNRRSATDLTRAQIQRFFRKGIIDEGDTRNMLKNIGYDDEEINYYVQDTKLDINEDFFDTVVELTGQLYINGDIGSNDVFSRLASVDMRREKIETYIEKWDIERNEKRKLPSKADVIKFFKSNIISKNKFEEIMWKIGYDKESIFWYLEAIQKEVI